MKQRLITGILAGAAFLTLLILGTPWYAYLITLLAMIGFFEFARLSGFESMETTVFVGYAAVAAWVFPWKEQFDWPEPSFEKWTWLLLFIFLALSVVTKNKRDIKQVSMLFVGTLYLGLGYHHMIELRAVENGLFWTTLLFVCIWVTDSGAYFTGKLIGKTKLWPAISPNKTVEGLIGGVTLAVLAALAFSVYNPELLSYDRALLIGLAVSLVGQMGDFIQSAYKRAVGIKDTGALLPGHGGVLDRTDSWLIVFPFVYYVSLLPLG